MLDMDHAITRAKTICTSELEIYLSAGWEAAGEQFISPVTGLARVMVVRRDDPGNVTGSPTLCVGSMDKRIC
jgi:hypothetical protein